MLITALLLTQWILYQREQMYCQEYDIETKTLRHMEAEN